MEKPTPKTYPASYKGKLLLATPDMSDPRIARAVIYLCGHDENGAMGLINDKPHCAIFVMAAQINNGAGTTRVAHIWCGEQ